MQGYDTDDEVSMGRVSDFSVEPSQESNPGVYYLCLVRQDIFFPA